MVLNHALSWLGTNLVSDISISLDFSHEANAPITSRHGNGLNTGGNDEKIIKSRRVQAVSRMDARIMMDTKHRACDRQ